MWSLPPESSTIRYESILRAGDRSVTADVTSLATSFSTRYYLQPSTLTTELGRGYVLKINNNIINLFFMFLDLEQVITKRSRFNFLYSQNFSF